jgi:LysM repeat protein
MQGKHLSRISLLLMGVLALMTTAGCFQPAGSGFEQPITIGSQPTFTIEPTAELILPTNTPEPSPTPPELEIVFDTPTPVQVAVLPSPTLEPTPFVFPTNPPVDNSAAVNALLTPSGIEVAQLATATLPGAVPLNPFEITATFIVGQATLQAGLPATQTAQAIFGAVPTPTPNLLFPTAVGLGTPTLGVPVQPGVDCVHEVQATDRNLYRISLAYGTTVAAIAQASGVTNINLIYVGQRLTIPGCGTTGYQPPPTSIPANNALGTPIPGGTGSVGGGRTHVVEQGETLFEISLQYGVPVASIAAANGIADINRIFLGQTLTIP